MFTILILLAFAYNVVGEECEPGFADTCFSAVTEDLQYMINLKKMNEVNVTSYTVTELCLALEDSLNCTSDVIDTDCTEHDGRNVFDSWLMAFRSAYHYVCDGSDHAGLTEILHGISCWSIEDFVLCVQEKASLTSFQNILHMDMDESECEDLHRVMSRCKASATVGSCREQDFVLEAVQGMIHAFFAGSDCNIQHSSAPKAQFSVIGIAFQIIMLLLVL